MDAPRLNISPRLREIMGYRKFAAQHPRMLVLRSHYWLDAACIRAAERMGWEVHEVPTLMEGALPREHVERLFFALASFRPDFVLSINLSGMDEQGLFARFFDDLELPLVTWFVDDPRTIMLDRACYGGTNHIALTWDTAYADYLRARGFAEAHYMPLAADTGIFDAEPAEAWPHPPSFVGNSMAAQAAREWAWVTERPVLAEAVTRALEEGRVTREHFGEGLAAMLGEACAAGLDEHERRHAEILLFVEGTRRMRRALLARLADLKVHARGDAGWRDITPHFGPPLDYEHALPAFYRDCAINLNITSIQMPNAVNQRVFDCPAAGGFLLTDAQLALNALFEPERETVTFASLEECREQVARFSAHPGERRAIAQRAKQRVLGEHTYAHRLERLRLLLQDRFR